MAQDGGRREGALEREPEEEKDPRVQGDNASQGMLVPQAGAQRFVFVLAAVEPVCQTWLYSKPKT